MSDSRNDILLFCRMQKAANPEYRIVDIGGAAAGWSSEVSDLLVDINSSTEHKNCINADICTNTGWETIFTYVKQHGMFDYAICTHTLEDVYNPFLSIENLPKIAKAGVITMPSAKKELTHCENPRWLGYIHHRWLFDEIDGVMYIVPKLPIFDAIVYGNQIPSFSGKDEVQYYWEAETGIPYKLFMNGFHGPNVNTVYSEFLAFTKKQIERAI